ALPIWAVRAGTPLGQDPLPVDPVSPSDPVPAARMRVLRGRELAEPGRPLLPGLLQQVKRPHLLGDVLGQLRETVEEDCLGDVYPLAAPLLAGRHGTGLVHV